MPLVSSNFWDDNADLIVRVFYWQNSGVAQEFYPAQPDELWRYVQFSQLSYSKAAGAVGYARFSVFREGLVNPAHIHERQLLAATDTALAAGLQSGEHLAEAAYWGVSTGLVNSSGILVPPRSRLLSEVSNNVFSRWEGVIYEATAFEKLKGLV